MQRNTIRCNKKMSLSQILSDSIDQKKKHELHMIEKSNPKRNRLINDLADKIIEAVKAKDIHDGNKVVVRVHSKYHHPLTGGHSYVDREAIQISLNKTLKPHGIQLYGLFPVDVEYDVKMHSFSQTKTA